MKSREPSTFMLRHVYPGFRLPMGAGRALYGALTRLATVGRQRPTSNPALPTSYKPMNHGTVDGELELACLEGSLPENIDGTLYTCQCLGAPEAFMVGDTNLARVDFRAGRARLTNRLMWTPAAMARVALEGTRHRFGFLGLMYLSPGLGLSSYTEGLFLMPDGRIAVTSDVDRPWLVDPESLRAETPLGRRADWLPMMGGTAGEAMGSLFPAFANSHVAYTDLVTREVFLVSWQPAQEDGGREARLMRWDGEGGLESWRVMDEAGDDIVITQNIHELAFSRDWILLADTAFVTGAEMLAPWKSAPLPSPKTALWLVDRRSLRKGEARVVARRVEVERPCIHLVAEYENPGDLVTFYTLDVPATNTAELLRPADRDLDGHLFPANLAGYGTLPVVDLSSVGRHVVDAARAERSSSTTLADPRWTWGPYLYGYMGRQTKPYEGQDLFVLFKGFRRELLPRRVVEAYGKVKGRQVPIEKLTGARAPRVGNSICRVRTEDLALIDAYEFPEAVLCHTMACVESQEAGRPGHVVAGVLRDPVEAGSSGSEYWIFDAADLAKGPVCRLGHPRLDHQTLFHTLYVPRGPAPARKPPAYRVELREDYPREEVSRWSPELLETFERAIWPYFGSSAAEAREMADNEARLLGARRATARRRARDSTPGNAAGGREDLIGEARLRDAPAFAERMVSEAERLWSSAGWKRESSRGGLVVESKPVSGTFESSGVLLARAAGRIEAPAQEVFDLLVSPRGYAILDPVSDPDDHAKAPIETFAWRPGARLEVAEAMARTSGKRRAAFVVLNAIDPAERVFVSKSILHDARPGGSRYSGEPEPSNGSLRALNTMAIKTEPLPDGSCRLLALNWADLPGLAPPYVMNLINARFFFKPLYRRIAKAVQR